MLLIILIAVQLILLLTLICPSRSRFTTMTAAFNERSNIVPQELETDLGVLDRFKLLFDGTTDQVAGK